MSPFYQTKCKLNCMFDSLHKTGRVHGQVAEGLNHISASFLLKHGLYLVFDVQTTETLFRLEIHVPKTKMENRLRYCKVSLNVSMRFEIFANFSLVISS